MSYENPAAYFTAADARAAQGSRQRSNPNSFLEYAAKRKNQIAALKKGRQEKRDVKSTNFWSEYQQTKSDLEKMNSAMGKTFGKKGAKSGQKGNTTIGGGATAQETELLAFNNQITAQLSKIGEELAQKLSGPGADDMTEQQIQDLIGSSLGRVTSLHETITYFTAAAEEYYNAPKDGRSNSILSSSNPQMQILFDKLQDDEINLIVTEDPNGDWNFIPMDKSIAPGDVPDTYDLDGDSRISPEERLKYVTEWMADPNNSMYTTDPKTGEISYNHVNDIGVVNASDIGKKFKNGNSSTFFQTVGDLQSLQKDFDQAYNQWFSTHGKGLQRVQPTADGSEMTVAPFTGADGSSTVVGASAKPGAQSWNNEQQLEALLDSEAGNELFEAFLASETLESDLSGWMQEDYDFGQKTAKELKAELRTILKNRALTLNPNPYQESVKPDSGNPASAATNVPYK